MEFNLKAEYDQQFHHALKCERKNKTKNCSKDREQKMNHNIKMKKNEQMTK